MEEYMLRVHEAVAVVKHAYPDQVPNEGEGLRRDHFYYGLIPSLRDERQCLCGPISSGDFERKGCMSTYTRYSHNGSAYQMH